MYVCGQKKMNRTIRGRTSYIYRLALPLRAPPHIKDFLYNAHHALFVLRMTINYGRTN